MTDDGSGDPVTVTATVADPAVGTLVAGLPGATAVAGGWQFTGSVADANAWLNGLQFVAADTELGLTAATTAITVAVDALDPIEIDVTVTPTNDPTTIADATQTVTEGSTTVLTVTTLDAHDAEVEESGTQVPEQIVYALLGDPDDPEAPPLQHGYLTLGGVRLGVGSVFTQADVIAGRIQYHHTATGAAQNLPDSFRVRVNDGATPTEASAVATITLEVAPVNQLPTVSGSGSVYEGQPANALDASGNPISVVGNFIQASGGGDPGDQASLRVRITDLPADGTLYFDGVAIAAGFEFDYADRGLLTYANFGDRDESSPTGYPFTDGFTVVVVDAGGGTGTPASTVPTRIDIVVRPVNDDPVYTGDPTPSAAVTPAGDGAGAYVGPFVVTLTPAMLNATDVDSGSDQLSFVVTSESFAHGRLLFDGQYMPEGSTFTLADIAAGRVQYVQLMGAEAGATDSFTFEVIDNTFGPGWNDDGSFFSRVGGVYEDHLDTPETRGDDRLRSYTFTIELAPTLEGNGSNLPNAPDRVPAESSSEYAGFNGIAGVGELEEGGTIVLGGTNRDADTPGLSYTVPGVPTAQVLYTIEGYEGGGPGGNGTLQIDTGGGNWVDLGTYATFTQADLDAGRIRFQHDGDVEDFVSSVRFSVSAGVLAIDPDTDTLRPDSWQPTFTFYVRPLNDAPVATGSSDNVVREGGTLIIGVDQLSIRDPDDAYSTDVINGTPIESLPGDVSDPNYALNHDAANPLHFEVQSLPAGGTLEYLVAGTWAAAAVGTQIDAALLASGGVRFVSDGSEVRNTSFDVRGIDRWGAYSNTATVSIAITNVNDAPEIDRTPRESDGNPNSSNNPLTVPEGSFAQITPGMLTAYDPDSSLEQVQYTLTGRPGQGRIAYSTDGGVTFQILGVGSSFTQVDVNSGYIYYLHDGRESDGADPDAGDDPSDRFTFTLSDGDKELTGREFWIYVDPINDPPGVTAPTGPINLDSTTPGLNPVSGFTVSDPDLVTRTAGEEDYLQVTVRLLQADGTPFTEAQYAELGGVLISSTASAGLADGDKNGANDYLVLRGTRAQIQAALDALDVTFGSDRDQVFQVQVIVDDRLRDPITHEVLADANGGSVNQPGRPGLQPGETILTTELDIYADAVPAPVTNPTAPRGILGNIAAASVLVRASSENDPAVLLAANPDVTTYEDQYTPIGAALDLTLSDVESEAFGLPVTVTLSVPSGTLGIGPAGGQTLLTPPGAGREPVTVSGDESGTLVLTGRASDIEALLRDPAMGLSYRSASNVNHDLNGVSAGDVTLTISLSDRHDQGGAGIGDDTGAGSQPAVPAPVEVAITIVPVNDVPVVSAGTGLLPITGTTPVPGFSVADVDNTDGGALDGTAGEADFMQVTVRLTSNTGVPLAAGDYGDGVADHIVISSANAASGVTVDGTHDGTGSALVIRGTVAQVNAYLAGLQVEFAGGPLANSDVRYRVEVIADDRLRDPSTGALTAGANGGGNNNAAGGTQAVPGAAVDPYAATPAGLQQNVHSAWREIFPSLLNDPAQITVVDGGITVPESNGTVTLGGINVADSDALDNPLTATVTVPAGFTITGAGGAGGNAVISPDGTSVTLTGSQTQLNTWLNAITVQLPDPDGGAGRDDWHGSFPVTIVVDDGGYIGARPGTLVGDSNDPGSEFGDYDYVDPAGTSANLITTRTFDVIVTPVNDAPLVTDTTPVTLAPVDEDVAQPAGAMIESLFPPTRFSDVKDDLDLDPDSADNDRYFGVAINSLAVNAAQGAWQYSTDGGLTWTAVGNRSDANALVLDRDDRLRFVPAGNFHGTPASLTVRLVETNDHADPTSTTVAQAPVSGATVNLSTPNSVGDTSRYSAATILLSTTVVNVNDRPTGTDASLPAGVEDQAGEARTVSQLFGSGYSDATDNQSGIAGGGNAATAFGGIAIVGNAATADQGQWQYFDGVDWVGIGTPSDGSALTLAPDTLLRFEPVANFNGTPGSLTVRLSDAPVSVGTADISAAVVPQSSQWSVTRTLSTTVAPVNDAPVLDGTATNPTVTENNQTGTGVSVPETPLLSGVSVSDLDLASTPALADGVFGGGSITITLTGGFAGSGDVLSVAALPGVAATDGGTNGAPLVVTFTPGATVAQVEAILEAIQFSNTGDNPTNYGANTTRGYTVVLNDGNNAQAGGNAGTGGALDSAVLTGTITLVATNDPPAANDDARSVTEGDGPISGNVILGGQPGEQADTDPDNLDADLSVSAVRLGPEAGTGAAGTVGTTFDGVHGTLLLNADGSYTYTLDNDDPRVQALIDGETLTDVFTYAIDDGVGGTDVAQLTITIRGAANGSPGDDLPTLGVTDANGGATGQLTVYEAGLTSAGDTSETAGGTLTIAAADGITAISVGGTTITLAQLQNGAGLPIGPIATDHGVIMITGFTPGTTTTDPSGNPLVTSGTVHYSYTLTAALSHPVAGERTDVVALSVTDRDGDVAPGTLTVLIVDDVPQAEPDTATIDEDAAAPITGNVFTNDRIGADGAALAGPVTALSFDGTTPAVGTRFATDYGWLTVNADGSYSYELNNADPRVQALIAGETLTEEVGYTITDSDGDLSPSTLTLTIHGAIDGSPGDDLPTLSVTDANGGATGQLTVYEAGLTSAGDTSETETGTLSIGAADGITAISVGGTAITLAQLQASGVTPIGPIVTGHGTLTITGFTPGTITTDPSGNPLVTSGTVHYSYTLTAALSHPVAGERTDVVALSVTDRDGDVAPGTLTVLIVDDVPQAEPDTATIDEDAAAPITGNVFTNDRIGADGAALAGPVTALSFDGTTPAVGTRFATDYGWLTVNADGSYSYELDNSNPAVNGLKNGDTLTEVVGYSITDSDDDPSSSTLTLTIQGRTDGAPAIAPVDGNGAATGEATVHEAGLVDGSGSEAATGGITLEALDGLTSVTVGGTTVDLAALQALGQGGVGDTITIDTGEGTLVLTGFTPVEGTPGIVTGGTLAYTYTLKDPIVNAPGATDSTDVIDLAILDAGGGTSTGTLTVQIVDDVPVAEPDTATIDEDDAPVSGNVFTNDRIGADGSAVAGPVTALSFDGTTPAVGTRFATDYGWLTVNADGSYTYELNNADPRVQALIAGETLTEEVGYTITDSDGDASPSTLTVTIRGALDGSPGDDLPTLSVTDANGGATGQLTVHEAGLTSAGDTSETETGTLSIGAADGISAISVGGTTITLAQLQNGAGLPIGPITTDHGVIMITGFTPGTTTTDANGDPLVTSGTVHYSYTLTTALSHPVAGERTDVVALGVTDRDGDVAPGTLTVLIVDDVPSTTDDSNTIAENDVSVSGNVFTNDRIGADGAALAGPVTALNFGATTPAVGTRFATDYGWLTVNADGSYSYELDNSNPAVNGLKSGDTLTEVVGYTITDSDGDSAPATLTLTIEGHTDGAPGIAPVDGNGAATGEATVHEAGLVDSSGSEAATGGITLEALDGLTSVTVGGTTVDLAALQALGQGGVGDTITIDTGEGTLVLTGFTPVEGTPGIVTGGTLAYTYTLKDPIVNAPGATDSTDVIDLAILDAGGGTSTGTLTVQIVDDVPVAQPDTATVDEDDPDPITGNVRGNDYQGADVVNPAVGVPVTGYTVHGNTGLAGVPVAGEFGTITINADGSYSYMLDNGNPQVNALLTGETLTETVRYTLTDVDGDASETTLTITIRGRTDGAPAIAPIDGNGAATGEATVNERGLADGGGSDSTVGSISVNAPDGLLSVTIGGVLIPLADLQAPPGGGPITIVTPEGVLEITGFTPQTTLGIVTGGSIDYRYTLTRTQVNAPGATETTETIALRVTQADVGGSTSDGTLTVRIVDDVPEASDDSATITEDGAPTVSGSVKANDVDGADDANGVPVTDVRFGGITVPAGTTLVTQYGSIVVHPDGSYTYTLDNSHPAVQRLIPGETLVDTVHYTITDNDGDTSTAALTITIEGTTDPVTLQIVDGNGPANGQLTVDERGLNDPTDPSESAGGRMVIGAPDGVDRIVIGGSTVTIGELLDLGNTPVSIVTDKGTLTLTGFDPGTGTLTYVYTLDRNQPHNGGEVTDDIPVTVFDRDGDSATGTLTVLVIDDVPQARDDTATVSTARPDPTSVSGNVFGPGGAGGGDVTDRLGADYTPTPVTGVSFDGRTGEIGVPLQGNYGQLQLNADGSYTYTVDTTNPRVAVLGEGQTLTEVYTYTITDADGSTSTATLTVTLRGVSQHRWPGAADDVWPADFASPTRRIAQGMAPALFVQLAVAESRELSQRLTTGLATRAAGGVDEVTGGDTEIVLDGLGQAPSHAEHVSRDGVAFSRAMVRDVQRTLAQRGIGASSFGGGANGLFGDFDGLRALPAQDAPADVPPVRPQPAGRAAPPAAERISVPRADAVDAAEEGARAAAVHGGTSPMDTVAMAVEGAPSFSQRVAASAGERGTVRDIASAPVRIRIPAEPLV